MVAEISSTTWVAVLLLGLLSVITTLVGVALAVWIGRSERLVSAGVGFSAGIMLLISFLELIPEALGERGALSSLSAVALGMLIVAALHWIIPHTHLVEERGMFSPVLLRTAYLVAFGLILHDVPEGFAMANAYVASPSLGVLVALAIALHNIPEEFAMAVPIVTVRKKRLLYSAAFLSGLAEPLGAMIGLAAVHVYPGLNALFMAFAAGAMIFVSVHELLPMARRYGNIGLFISGGVASVFVYVGLEALV